MLFLAQKRVHLNTKLCKEGELPRLATQCQTWSNLLLTSCFSAKGGRFPLYECLFFVPVKTSNFSKPSLTNKKHSCIQGLLQSTVISVIRLTLSGCQLMHKALA